MGLQNALLLLYACDSPDNTFSLDFQFDQFSNYEDRGNKFINVTELRQQNSLLSEAYQSRCGLKAENFKDFHSCSGYSFISHAVYADWSNQGYRRYGTRMKRG